MLVFDQVNAYQTRLLEGIRSVLEAVGLPFVVYAHDPFAHALRPPIRRLLLSHDVVGSITTILSDEDSQRELAQVVGAAARPHVHIGSAWPGGTSVGVDNAPGMRALMDHLLDVAGARRILLVRGPGHHPDAVEREQIVRDALALRGLQLPPSLVVEGRFDRDTAYSSVTRFLRSRQAFDAVVALNDRSALGALEALTAAGIGVPQDVLLTGFDDDVVAQEVSLGLTTVSQRLYEQGVRAAQLLLEQLCGTYRAGHETRPSELVLRASTGGNPDPASAHTAAPAGLPVEAAMERGLAINRAFMACHDMRQLLTALADNASRLGLRRALVVLNQPTEPGEAAQGSVVLRHMHGHTVIPAAPPSFPLRQVLPRHLRSTLTTGAWYLQPLSVEGEDLGYVLFEQQVPDRFVGELVRMDLSRAIDGLQRAARHAATLKAHAERLEGLVTERTAQLQAEVASRMAAEHQLTEANQELHRLNRVDGLTGVANRTRFEEYLTEQWHHHQHSQASLSLLLVDVDHFKAHNDSHGHLHGDAVLAAVADCLRAALTSTDALAARYGGDEFAVLLPDTGAAAAMTAAKRVQRRIAGLARTLVGGPAPTVSIGSATVVAAANASASSLVRTADEALYRAKEAGRNRIVA